MTAYSIARTLRLRSGSFLREKAQHLAGKKKTQQEKHNILIFDVAMSYRKAYNRYRTIFFEQYSIGGLHTHEL